ncbi:MAG: alpha/beta fold hydrolase [Terriglobales bacterium]
MKKVISKDGTAIAIERSGQGPALILVDGALCSRSFGPMPKLAPLLTPHFTVFTYDRRGRNESSDTSPYATHREVEDLEALINEAGGSAFVFGISSGAALALHAAASGLNITKLALFEPPYVGTNGHSSPPDHEGQLRQLIAARRRSDAVKYFMTKMVGAPAIFAAVMQLLPMWSKLTAVAHTLPYDAAIMGDFSIPVQRAASVKTPTLVIGGEKSPSLLQEAARQLAGALPRAQHRSLKGQSHNVSAKVLAPVLIEYFAA